MGLVSNILQRTMGKQKLRQWAANDRLGDFSNIRVVRRYEEDDEFVDLYWFIHILPSDDVLDSRFTRSLWSELDASIQQMEEGEVLLSIDEILGENETIKQPDKIAEKVEPIPVEEPVEQTRSMPVEPQVVVEENETINTPVSIKKDTPKMPKVVKRQAKLVHLLLNNPRITMPEMARKLKVSRPTITRDIDDMKKSGIIRHVGALKNGHWEVLVSIE